MLQKGEVGIMYDALIIAKYIVELSNKKGYSISNLKLQKIMYFIQALFLIYKNEACFREEIEAWDYGPVVPEVYGKYKTYGSAAIPYLGDDVSNKISKFDRTLIDKVVDFFSKYSASALVDLTHRQAPWKDAYIPYKKNVIPKKSIKEYFANAK